MPGRQKEFDRDKALDKAMEVFWKKGYEGASIHDLLKAMGITRGSLYHSFGSKKNLFFSSLERYNQLLFNRLINVFDEPGSSLKKIRKFFRKSLDVCMEDGTKGCLVIKTALEQSGNEQDLSSRLSSVFSRIEGMLYNALLTAQTDGEIKQKHDARALARFLTSCFYGLRVRAAISQNRRELQEIIELALSSLKKKK